jgi:hypothetical protein
VNALEVAIRDAETDEHRMAWIPGARVSDLAALPGVRVLAQGPVYLAVGALAEVDGEAVVILGGSDLHEEPDCEVWAAGDRAERERWVEWVALGIVKLDVPEPQ